MKNVISVTYYSKDNSREVEHPDTPDNRLKLARSLAKTELERDKETSITVQGIMAELEQEGMWEGSAKDYETSWVLVELVTMEI